MANVKFYSVKLKETYNALNPKDNLSLYWIAETSELYRGDQLFGTGAIATKAAAGLLSAEDKAKLDALVAASGNCISNLTPIDSSVVITDVANGGKAVGVAIAPQAGNALTAVDGGLFVPAAKEVIVPEYSIEKQEEAEKGYAVSYKLKKTVGEESFYVGDVINIAKDMVLQGATLQTVIEANVPYDGAVIGDPYIDMSFNDASASHIYIPVKGLVDTYTAGEGIKIVDGKISVKIAEEAHGLVSVDGAMSMRLASATQDGAMSKEDKAFIDVIPSTYATIERVQKTAQQVKYEIFARPEGTLVNYSENEIRVMCPADTKWTKQNVGSTGNANMYYMGFRAYAPESAVSFKEGDHGTVEDKMFTFDDDFAGVDEFGRKYSVCWFALASYNESTKTWSYFGEKSSTEKYIGWDYVVEWYNAAGVKIAVDSMRINLTNENCHSVKAPYYITALESRLDNIEQVYTWGEL